MAEALSWGALKKRSIDGMEDLVVAVVQDYEDGQVLMVAFMNQEAFERTLEYGRMHYYSTSRRKLWLKGESSGNFQNVREAYVDCDMDALLFKVSQKGGACHEGYKSCFYRKNVKGVLKTIANRLFNPDEVYKK